MITAARIKERWAAVEAGFAEHYQILDLGGRFNGRPLGYRKFLTLLAHLGVVDDGTELDVPDGLVEEVEDDGPPPNWWREMLPVPTPKISKTVTLDQFMAGID